MTTLVTKPFDPASFIRDDDDAAVYLNDALESGDPKVVAAALGDITRARGASAVAKAAGVSRASLYSGLSENGNPTLGLLMAVLKELNLEIRVKEAA